MQQLQDFGRISNSSRLTAVVLTVVSALASGEEDTAGFRTCLSIAAVDLSRCQRH
jgi:hypothetical protein